MVKGALMGAAAYLLHLLPILCGFHVIYVSADGNVLTSAVDTVANIVYLGLSLIGSIAFLYGLGRKMWLTAGVPTRRPRRTWERPETPVEPPIAKRLPTWEDFSIYIVSIVF
jgi:hypothetical protein